MGETEKAEVGRASGVSLRALLTDPIVNSITDARALMAELFEKEKEVLPAQWYE